MGERIACFAYGIIFAFNSSMLGVALYHNNALASVVFTLTGLFILAITFRWI